MLLNLRMLLLIASVWVTFSVVFSGAVVLEDSNGTVAIDSGTDHGRIERLQQQHVTVVGLGGMGTAIARCFAASYPENSSTEYVVHAWTRSGGTGGLDDSGASNERINIHKTANDAIASSLLTVIVIDDWNGAMSFIYEHEDELLNNNFRFEGDDGATTKQTRTVVLFSTYSPIDIQEFALSMSKRSKGSLADGKEHNIVHGDTFVSLRLVGGAIVGVPQTICSPRSLIMTSSSVPELRPLGTTVVLDSKQSNNIRDWADDQSIGNSIIDGGHDIGTAALMNMALVVTIFFGLVGHELAHLMIQRYGEWAEFEETYQAEFEETYQKLASDVAAVYTKMLLPSTSAAITTTDFHRMYAPTEAVLRLFRLVAKLKTHLGITDETFLDAHIRTLEWNTDPTRDGPPAWTQTKQATRSTGESKSSSASSKDRMTSEL